MVAPDDHRHLADLAFGDPADLVLVVPGGQAGRPAEIAAVHSRETAQGFAAGAHDPTPPQPGASGTRGGRGLAPAPPGLEADAPPGRLDLPRPADRHARAVERPRR